MHMYGVKPQIVTSLFAIYYTTSNYLLHLFG